MLAATVILVLGMAYGFWVSRVIYGLALVTWTVVLTLLYGLVILMIFYSSKAKGNPLIFTERGIALHPVVAELWEDIESYSWEEFKGINRVPGPTVLSLREGFCLKIINKGILQRCLEAKSRHSIFGTYLVFFSPEQMVAAESIINQYGIKKTE